MITYGYCKGYYYTGDGTLMVRCRIPSIHGPYSHYVTDDALPYYPSLLLPHLPNEGEVVAISSLDSGNSNFLVLGLTGASYYTGLTNLQG